MQDLLDMNSKPVTFVINGKVTLTQELDLQNAIKRSNLFKEIYESCGFNINHTINLTLERPEKFGILLHYIETELIGEELNNYATFASYINDIVYLGMHQLEIHALDMLQNSVTRTKSEQIDFSISRPTYDFMERFIRERTSQIQNHDYQLCILILKWIGMNQIQRWQISELTNGCINFEKLMLFQIQYLRNTYSTAFELLMSPSFLLDFWMQGRQTCLRCKKSVSKLAIGYDACFVQKNIKSSSGATFYQQEGCHC
eukprot:TRINITY_DN43679_c0_g5_i1.p1 TRINITY_DN43679_c0_g5~~TRINITY_DN43679_c0_g5_i1.p1  ORF type:complete len:286 (+),score=0.96 TRINITY_DN43679_c0_g5_i1:89-859(+)